MSDRPVCGIQPGEVIGDPVTGVIAVVGVIGTLVSVITGAVNLAGGAAAFTLAGMGGIGLAGVAGAAAVFGVTIYMLYNRCAPRDGGVRCWAGVVNGITDSFDSGWDVLFPSGAMHPRVDVVVKERFWPLVVQNADFVVCSPPPPGFGSPIIMTFYKSAAVCAAGVGAMVGAGIGVAAAVAIAIAIGAIGCATIILCLLALLIAAIIGAVIAIAGAMAGGAIGRAVAGDDSPHTSDGVDIAVGDLLTVNGKLLKMEEFENANVGWWGQATTKHGSVATQPPYSDSDAAQLVEDSCPLRDPPPAGGSNEPKNDPDQPDIR